MNRWLAEYAIAAHRTRWIGLIGTAAMLTAVVRELSSIYIGVSLAESPFEGDFADMIIAHVSMLVLVGIPFMVRAVFLLIFKPERYLWVALSWVLSFVAVVFYLSEMWPEYGPSRTCVEGGKCFEIYDQRSITDWVLLSALAFILLSIVCAGVTAAIAAGRAYRYK